MLIVIKLKMTKIWYVEPKGIIYTIATCLSPSFYYKPNK